MAAEQRKKVLLMGKSGSGKTSMRSIIFANYLARDTQRLNPTLDVQHSSVRFLGSLVLNLWDCGGQDAFYESYFVSRREHIFRNVAVLIYVFDVTSADFERDLDYYGGTVEALAQFSPDARVFALVHKCDMLPDEARARVAEERALAIRSRSFAFAPAVYRTSIWDETLYKAWSSVVHALIPNVGTLEAKLGALAGGCDADEVVLFERSSFLVISAVSRRTHPDVHRYEKISNIVKQFKLACSKSQSQLAGLRLGNSYYSVFIDAFTPTTYLLVVTSSLPKTAAAAPTSSASVDGTGADDGNLGLKPEVAAAAEAAAAAPPSSTPPPPPSLVAQPSDEATLLNIALARPHFERLIAEI